MENCLDGKPELNYNITMKKLFKYLPIFIASIAFSQEFIVFENNKKNKALFDYSDPNSLVSMLVQNQNRIIYSSCEASLYKDMVNEYSFHPIDGMKTYSCYSGKWEIEGDDEYRTRKILTRDSKDEKFEDWIFRLTSIGDETEIYAPLLRIDPNLLKKQYDLCGDNQPISLPPTINYFDVNNIDLIILAKDKIYFTKKSLYENKNFICLELSLDEIGNLARFDFLNEDLSKKITNKLREFQLRKREVDDASYPIYSITEFYDQYKQANLFDDFNENEFKYYSKSSSIKRIFPGGNWEIEGDDEDRTLQILTRNSMDESFEEWYNRLTKQGVAPGYNPEVFGPLTRLDTKGRISIATLKMKYDACAENQPLQFPDLETTYWVDYPNPAIYLQRKFTIDSTGKFKTTFSQLIFAERLDNKKGFSQKPQVLMVFGNEYEPMNKEISDLLKEELKIFELNQELPWRKIIFSQKGKKVNASELKKIVHCLDITENQIKY
jgi:hypothetical protein